MGDMMNVQVNVLPKFGENFFFRYDGIYRSLTTKLTESLSRGPQASHTTASELQGLYGKRPVYMRLHPKCPPYFR